MRGPELSGAGRVVVEEEGTGPARQKEDEDKVTSCPGLPGPVLGSPIVPGNRDSGTQGTGLWLDWRT